MPNNNLFLYTFRKRYQNLGIDVYYSNIYHQFVKETLWHDKDDTDAREWESLLVTCIDTYISEIFMLINIYICKQIQECVFRLINQ
jgi:hypothetical protein